MNPNPLFTYARKGLLFVISAPAGSGKTTLVQMLSQEFDCIYVSISCTTRNPRFNEIPDRDYIFLTEDQFKQKIKDNEFLEHAFVFGNYYGTCRNLIEEKRKEGYHVCLVVDTQGAAQLRTKIEDGVFIFIQPPSLQELRNRLILRNTDSMESIERRLKWAEKELEAAVEYDYQIVNDDLHICYEIFRSIVLAETHRIVRSNLYVPS